MTPGNCVPTPDADATANSIFYITFYRSGVSFTGAGQLPGQGMQLRTAEFAAQSMYPTDGGSPEAIQNEARTKSNILHI